MKKLYILFMIFYQAHAFAQSMSYGYDNVGNRICREIVMHAKGITDEETADIATEVIAERTVHIYPNPTKGILKIDIVGLNDTKNYSLRITDTTGKVITDSYNPALPASFDISMHPDGIYMLIITIEDHTSVWKIIKQ